MKGTRKGSILFSLLFSVTCMVVTLFFRATDYSPRFFKFRNIVAILK